MHNKQDIYKKVTETIIGLLETHLTEWNRPWVFTDIEGNSAHNALTGRAYNGVNQMLLSFLAIEKGYSKNAWLTFNQVQELKGSVIKGEKSCFIYFWKFLYYDKNGKLINSSIAEKLTKAEIEEQKITKKPILRLFPVFNVFQTKGLPEKFYQIDAKSVPTEFEKNEQAEMLILSTNATIIHKHGNRAFYTPATDTITLPERMQFTGTEPYYATALHEIGHWTGHPKRLNRALHGKFGSPEYAFEELVAELTSAFLCAELGFAKAITNNASYIRSWLKELKNDTGYIFKAAKEAEKASQFILSEHKVMI